MDSGWLPYPRSNADEWSISLATKTEAKASWEGRNRSFCHNFPLIRWFAASTASGISYSYFISTPCLWAVSKPLKFYLLLCPLFTNKWGKASSACSYSAHENLKLCMNKFFVYSAPVASLNHLNFISNVIFCLTVVSWAHTHTELGSWRSRMVEPN
jgi:hypothetical protein